ncbi:hypothetical protein F5Y05DRAFT_338948 [Hypoxylon sp. FL0543]|nr:hypothetical protein F5Y05DRAFT_338948 [Hypoxylon sp. FL0543]
MSARNFPNFTQRFIPDITRLFEFPNRTMASHQPANGSVDPRTLNYENTDLNEITRRQMNEDISAYRYDLDFCRNQLTLPDLTPQEIRTLQIRILDCGHNIRHCQHRIEQLDTQASRTQMAANAASASATASAYYKPQSKRTSTGTPGRAPSVKRKRHSSDGDEDDADIDVDSVLAPEGPGTNNVQRLGFWACRLCVSQTYLDAGTNRVPSAPCKWPLKDISKILNHYLDMHTEHSPPERLKELGAALAHNRGPFEYWLTRTRAQDMSSTDVDEFVTALQSGVMPEGLRGLNRAAHSFPNTVSGIKR